MPRPKATPTLTARTLAWIKGTVGHGVGAMPEGEIPRTS
jgi:hypothetical protein